MFKNATYCAGAYHVIYHVYLCHSNDVLYSNYSYNDIPKIIRNMPFPLQKHELSFTEFSISF